MYYRFSMHLVHPSPLMLSTQFAPWKSMSPECGRAGREKRRTAAVTQMLHCQTLSHFHDLKNSLWQLNLIEGALNPPQDANSLARIRCLAHHVDHA